MLALFDGVGDGLRARLYIDGHKEARSIADAVDTGGQQ